MRILLIVAYLIEIVIGAFLIVLDLGGIHVGPYPGPEPISPLFQLVGAALIIGGLAGLGGLVALNPQPEVPSRR